MSNSNTADATITLPSRSAPLSTEQLKTFLVEAPAMYNYRLNRAAEQQILTNCYRLLWGNNPDLMQKYFFKEGLSDHDNLSALLQKYNLFGRESKNKAAMPSNPENALVDPTDDEPEYWESQRGKQCGHLFKKGESVYRCRNCGLDDTCVLCSRCFHSTNHEGHDVKIWISRGSGGCCDCGDPEAWKTPLECKIHSLSAVPDMPSSDASQKLEPRSSVPPELLLQIKNTIRTVLDYILETFAASPENFSYGNAREIQHECELADKALGMPSNGDNLYACILWNDETHTFDKVIEVVKRAIGCTTIQAQRAAETVDAYGRHIVARSENLDELIRIADIISSIKLAVTIRSCKDTVREEICGLLLDWLKELISGRYTFFMNVERGNCVVRDIICEVLCEGWSLSPELAELSMRSRRTAMSDTGSEVPDDGYNTAQELDNDEEEMEEVGLTAAHLIDIDDDLDIIHAFEPANDEDWMDLEDDEEFEEDGVSEEDDDDDIDDPTYSEDVVMASVDVETQESSPRRHATHTEQQTPHRHEDNPAPVTAESSQTSLGNNMHRRHSTQRTADITDLNYGFSEWLGYTEKLEAEEYSIADFLGFPIAPPNVSCANINKKIRKEFNRKLRLDYLMQFDLRLWKSARANIKDLFIGTVVSNFDYRPTIGIRFARNYPETLDAFFLKDREPEHSISTLSVQLLTVPTVAALLVREYRFFGMVCSILANFFLTDRINLMLTDKYRNVQVDCGSRAIRRPRFAFTFYDLRYVLNTDMVKPDICQSPLYLRHFVDLLYQFQAMDPIVRSSNVHVEYESTTWVGAFNATLQISKLCRLFSDCYSKLSTTIPRSEASRVLCRSISRVLKAIVDWAPHFEDDDDNTNGQQIIKGVKDQKIETVHTLHAGTFNIISYDIAKDPVSFHHPYHWLLSGMLEHVDLLTDDALEQFGYSNGLKGLVQQFENIHPIKNVFMAIAEYPLRVRALLAQVNYGVWVRNGFGIRNQARTYRDVSVRENTYDSDLYILQTALTVSQPDQMLTTMLDRFSIRDWFDGHPDKPHAYYDSTQMALIVEEFLDFLIICATERGYAAGMTIDAKIRKAIIQYLGLSSMAYSELVKVLPDSLSEHESFENHLGELSVYKAPAGLSDHGRYELKEEYYSDIDPYFWHFSRNQREEAFEKLRGRAKKQKTGDKKPETEREEFFFQPKLTKIKSGPFKHIGNFLHSHVLCQIVFYGLWNTRTAKTSSELIIDHSLYLAIIALTDENNEIYERQHSKLKGKGRAGAQQLELIHGFVQHATDDKYPILNGPERERVSLLTILLRFLGDRDYAHTHKRCSFIVRKIEELGSAEAKETISQWRLAHEKTQVLVASEEKPSSVSEYERKKSEAKARQADIMAQFAKAQSQFMSAHADLYDDDGILSEGDDQNGMDEANDAGETDIVRTCHFPSGTCIVCQEELDRSKLYGILGLVQKSKELRKTPLRNSDVLWDVFETAQGNDTWSEHFEASSDKKSQYRGFPIDAHVEGLHISTCGHLMHAHCFNGYQESVDNDTINPIRVLLPQLRHKQFLCPLCKALGNVLLPIVWKSKKESYPGPVATKTDYDSIAQNAKCAMADLESSIGPAVRIPGSMEEELDIKNDPDVELEDVDGLRRLYNQIRNAMKKGPNEIILNTAPVTELRASIVDMYNMYAYAIAVIEVAQRGEHGLRARDVTVEHTGTFLDDISSQSQTLLKILAKTGELMPKVMNTEWVTDDRYTMQRLSLSVLRQVFYDETAPEPLDSYDRTVLRKPLLLDDPFQTLARLSFITSQQSGQGKLEAHHLLRLLYIAEITKATIGLLQGLDESAFSDAKTAESFERLKQRTVGKTKKTESMCAFVRTVAGLIGIPTATVQRFFEVIPPHVFATLLRIFTLPYLRRSLLLMVVHHGFIPQSQDYADENVTDNDEYERIVRMLNLPEFPRVFDLAPIEQELVSRWCGQYAKHKVDAGHPLLGLPTPFYMVSLPYRMDKLFDDSARRVCRKCGNLPEYPALCLICGTFVCARRYCCTENNVGECNTHMKSCSGDVGIFLVVKESFVLLLHADGGSIMSAPYLDSHGEVDIFLKRGTPQFLNPQRYEQIRQMWLSHGVPAYVRRKMESSYSYTRWESW
ncbi:hypothetical protein BX666DRAFT_1565983 [Dichotomocladium elegans]|nr:hypothetical protein BX666DRAFT_1565983 [Dichotomocladium elegans]